VSPPGNLRIGGRRKPGSPQSSLELGPDPSAPPPTRAECPTERPCPRTRCVHNLMAETEVAGRPHHGAHNAPRLRAHEPWHPPMWPPLWHCAVDATDAYGDDQVPLPDVARSLGVSNRRVQQVESRGLDKQWVALRLLEVVEAWAEVDVYPRGGDLEHLWGVILDDEGGELARANDVDRVCVTLVVNVKKLRRPSKDVPAGVTIRRKEAR